jgi:hypothetical protein
LGPYFLSQVFLPFGERWLSSGHILYSPISITQASSEASGLDFRGRSFSAEAGLSLEYLYLFNWDWRIATEVQYETIDATYSDAQVERSNLRGGLLIKREF